MTTSQAKPISISVGFQWRNAAGKVWVVTGTRPGGVCEIYRVGRAVSGETYTRLIRDGIAAGTVIPMELTDEARAILRRCNA